jgi:hypothetical protein
MRSAVPEHVSRSFNVAQILFNRRALRRFRRSKRVLALGPPVYVGPACCIRRSQRTSQRMCRWARHCGRRRPRAHDATVKCNVSATVPLLTRTASTAMSDPNSASIVEDDEARYHSASTRNITPAG